MDAEMFCSISTALCGPWKLPNSETVICYDDIFLVRRCADVRSWSTGMRGLWLRHGDSVGKIATGDRVSRSEMQVNLVCMKIIKKANERRNNFDSGIIDVSVFIGLPIQMSAESSPQTAEELCQVFRHSSATASHSTPQLAPLLFTHHCIHQRLYLPA